MKKIKLIIPILAFLAVFMSCEDFSTDLEVENVENPNDKILSSDPVALSATSEGIINNWFMTVHDYSGPGLAMQTMADVSTCSWGNAGMRDLSSEPRAALNNTSAYGNNVTRSYFNALYSVLTDSNTLGFAVANGTDFDDPSQIEMVSKLGQALSIGYLALVFDKVWISDETGAVVGSGLEGASTYAEAMTFALGKLDQAIAIAKSNNISLSETAIPGGGGSNATLVEFMNSMGARMLVGNLRNGAEKASADWAKVLTYANAGITADFEIYMDDATWYDL
ncbi:MAG: hypothetical protein ACI9K4_000574, partial [Polaribacter sp.]